MKLKDLGRQASKKNKRYGKNKAIDFQEKYHPQSMKGRMDRIRRIIDGFCHCGKFNTHLLK